MDRTQPVLLPHRKVWLPDRFLHAGSSTQSEREGRVCKAHDFREFTWRNLNFFSVTATSQPNCRGSIAPKMDSDVSKSRRRGRAAILRAILGGYHGPYLKDSCHTLRVMLRSWISVCGASPHFLKHAPDMQRMAVIESRARSISQRRKALPRHPSALAILAYQYEPRRLQ